MKDLKDLDDVVISASDLIKFSNLILKFKDEFIQKIKIVDKSVVEGQAMVNKETKEPIIDEATGVPKKWDDKFKITFISSNNGGDNHSIYVNQDIYDRLEVDKIYIAEGSVSYKKYSGDYSSRAVVKFDKFKSEDDLLQDFISEIKNKPVAKSKK